MLNSEKIRLMTRLTVYEEGLGVKDGRTAEYFRNDYILFGLVGSFVAGSLAWGVLLVTLLVFYRRSAAFARRRGMYQQDLEALTEICDREIGIQEKDAV